MFCTNCGKELPDDANYCLKCGHPQKQSAVARQPISSPATKYEICTLKVDIRSILWLWDRAKWEAWVGNSRIAQGGEYPFGSFKILQENMKLVSNLMSEGWEIMTTNETGAVMTMRRLKR